MDFDKQSRSAKINLKEVEEYLKKQGYTKIRLNQLWRHVTGVVYKGGQKQFFKMASTPEIGEKTRNEFAWNEIVASNILPTLVPKNFESGNFQNLFWFTSEYIDGSALGSTNTSDNNIEHHLGAIVTTIKKIISLKSDKLLPNDITYGKIQGNSKDIFLERIRYWMSRFPQKADNLYRFIEERVSSLQIAPSHDDFTPWHLIKTKDNLYLIDGEHAKMRGIEFYDVAYFYHRTYTKLKQPELAKKFMKLFISEHQTTKKDQESLLTILAQRIIGGYMDAVSDNTTSVELQKQLQCELLEGKIFE